MNVYDAVMHRRSIRGYLPKAVPEALIREVLDAARWAPSGTNTQPWNMTVVSGKRLISLGDALVEACKLDPKGRTEIPYPDFQGEHQERRRTVGFQVYEAKGIARDDRARRAWWWHEGLHFFHAPTAIFVHTPKNYTPYTLVDIGLMSMAMMLVAEERGLGTCPMKAPADYPDVVKDHLGIPENEVIGLVIAMGYPDLNDPVNKFPRQRVELDKLARFLNS